MAKACSLVYRIRVDVFRTYPVAVPASYICETHNCEVLYDSETCIIGKVRELEDKVNELRTAASPVNPAGPNPAGPSGGRRD